MHKTPFLKIQETYSIYEKLSLFFVTFLWIVFQFIESYQVFHLFFKNLNFLNYLAQEKKPGNLSFPTYHFKRSRSNQ